MRYKNYGFEILLLCVTIGLLASVSYGTHKRVSVLEQELNDLRATMYSLNETQVKELEKKQNKR